MPEVPMPHSWAERVRVAHGDAWATLGVAGTAELPGVRLMATGLDHPQWNNGDVDDPVAVDIDQVRRWYAGLGVPWGMMLPAGAPFAHGRFLFGKRLMGLDRTAFQPAPAPTGVVLRSITEADFDEWLRVDAAGFDEEADVERPWLELLLRHPAVTTGVATVDGEVVGAGSVTRSDGRAGGAGYVAGIVVAEAHRRRGIGAAITSWLVEQSDVDFFHLHPDTDEAARIYARLGFVEVPGFDIYVDCA